MRTNGYMDKRFPSISILHIGQVSGQSNSGLFAEGLLPAVLRARGCCFAAAAGQTTFGKPDRYQGNIELFISIRL